MTKREAIRWAGVAFGLLTLLAIGWQLSIQVRLGFNAVNFFSYFTNLSNLFAAFVLIMGARHARVGGGESSRFDRLRLVSAANMAVVGIVFAILLRDVDLGALRPWVNTLLHYVMPIVVVLDWLLLPPARAPALRALSALLLFPAAYILYVLIRGAATDWYPYPFLNPSNVGGYGGVASYVVGIALTFVIAGTLLIRVGRLRSGLAGDSHIAAR